MNTEAMNTLKQVREGIGTLQVQLNDHKLTGNERGLLEEVLGSLQDLEDIIINNVLQEMVDKINACNAKLKDLILNMQAASDKISAFSKLIQKISNVVGVLASITAKAMSVGIL